MTINITHLIVFLSKNREVKKKRNENCRLVNNVYVLNYLSLLFFIDKDLPNRYPVDNNDEPKRSTCYNEQNVSNIVYTPPDVKYNSFQ
jgi:hypothetical protein